MSALKANATANELNVGEVCKDTRLQEVNVVFDSDMAYDRQRDSLHNEVVSGMEEEALKELVKHELYGAYIHKSIRGFIDNDKERKKELTEKAECISTELNLLLYNKPYPEKLAKQFKRDGALFKRIKDEALSMYDEITAYVNGELADKGVYEYAKAEITGNDKCISDATRIITDSDSALKDRITNESRLVLEIISYLKEEKEPSSTTENKFLELGERFECLRDIAVKLNEKQNIEEEINKTDYYKRKLDRMYRRIKKERKYQETNIAPQNKEKLQTENGETIVPDFDLPPFYSKEDDDIIRYDMFGNRIYAPEIDNECVNLHGLINERGANQVTKAELPYLFGSNPAFTLKTDGPEKSLAFLESPKAIKEVLDECVFGQEKAKKLASIIAYQQLHGIRNNALFIGPSGCGKTEIFRTLKARNPLVFIYNASDITGEGWKGNKKFHTIFEDMLAAGFNKWQIEHSIIVLDEFDKLIAPFTSSSGENMHADIQGQLLAAIEGTDLQIRDRNGAARFTINTSGICFIMLGAFEDLRNDMKDASNRKALGFGAMIEPEKVTEEPKVEFEDVIRFGMTRELAGRIGNIVQLQAFSKDDFTEFMLKKRSIIENKIREEYKLSSFSISDELARESAVYAADTNLGVRGMISYVKNHMNEIIYETGEMPIAV